MFPKDAGDGRGLMAILFGGNSNLLAKPAPTDLYQSLA
jgi:hypothetical protein